ncbi:aspartate/glutamate racemase family protein [Uliginosibacterium sp. H1]|uniref:aspartate/glutamate racemase family protein n=1 Tax=Uliginosibacterium sp. H1 TaxID=3114757 RepID=UPI002E1914E0|nr:aspartate/glutamate racemase family protein [Uliginosibacterium sp. H1]
MPQALIINPNTSASVTALMLDHARALAGDALTLTGSTASFGASYIASETSYAIAGHAALDCWARDAGAAQAVLIGCFGDPGLPALREICPVPVVGLAEAAMLEAAKHGRFAIVTGGPRWVPILHRLAVYAGVQDRLADISVVERSGAELAADRSGAIVELAALCRRTAAANRLDAIVLGGAALAGMGEEIAALTGLPVIDSVSAGVRALVAACRQQAHPLPPDGATYDGLSPALQHLLAPHPPA